jgi:hypothetical protein
VAKYLGRLHPVAKNRATTGWRESWHRQTQEEFIRGRSPMDADRRRARRCLGQ